MLTKDRISTCPRLQQCDLDECVRCDYTALGGKGTGRPLTYKSPQQDAALGRLQATNYSPGNSASVGYAQKLPDSNAVLRSCMPARDVENSHEAEVAIHRPRCPNRAPLSGRAARSSIHLRQETAMGVIVPLFPVFLMHRPFVL